MTLTTIALDKVVENLHTTVIILDEEMRLRYINPAGEILFAASAPRFIGLPVEDLILDPELVESLSQVLHTYSPFTERELVINLGLGHRVTVDLTALPLQDEGLGQGLLVEMKQQDRHLRISREEGLLAQGNATRALIRGLAHEIKNPLGGLRGAAQLLERELHNEELKEYTHIIISEADRLQSLMNQMLGPNALPKRRPLNIHEPLERVRQVVTAELSDKVCIVRDYDPSIPEICADPDQLIQALMNLVRNAAQAVGEEGEITLRTRSMRRYTIGHTMHRLVARIDIIDNGTGISEEMRESLFLPMITGRAEGTGLGLPIAQSMINLNGGLIEWESEPGKTIFTVLLPVAAESRNGIKEC